MISLDCPCGNSGEYPESSVTVKCDECGRTRRVVWFSGPRACEQWRRWSTWDAKRVLATAEAWQAAAQ